MRQLIVTLSDSQEQELQDLVAHHPKAYIREKACAILKIAQGHPGIWVAQNGLLRKRRKNTVYDWVHSYQTQGITGLFVKKGRGLKPSFSP
ncbi:helix-turn-helix domain-containing protein [Arcicella aquatica]|uniref:Helix-turn-helix domain-containing protein n=1 Tax=Arcicella aquatica TaxID=217141 RepID=A0ABU5QRI9_9BACT|nr:helix-turn-helix domain-containing protein [Arcicella aquatica]MEA5259439.1 helix-turn-helix domain-containing protein [Arcicella aquatica]